jgi:hypothetical protein
VRAPLSSMAKYERIAANAFASTQMLQSIQRDLAIQPTPRAASPPTKLPFPSRSTAATTDYERRAMESAANAQHLRLLRSQIPQEHPRRQAPQPILATPATTPATTASGPSGPAAAKSTASSTATAATRITARTTAAASRLSTVRIHAPPATPRVENTKAMMERVAQERARAGIFVPVNAGAPAAQHPVSLVRVQPSREHAQLLADLSRSFD